MDVNLSLRLFNLFKDKLDNIDKFWLVSFWDLVDRRCVNYLQLTKKLIILQLIIIWLTLMKSLIPHDETWFVLKKISVKRNFTIDKKIFFSFYSKWRAHNGFYCWREDQTMSFG